MTKDFCPLIKETCKGFCCKWYYDEISDCSWSWTDMDNMKWRQEDLKKTPLKEVHKEIADILLNVSMNKITVENGLIPDGERQLLIKLNNKRQELQANESLEKMWSK